MPIVQQVPFDYSYWVVHGRFVAGCYPGSPDEDEARRRLAALQGVGVDFMVNLMLEQETGAGGARFSPYEALLDPHTRAVRLPLVDMQVPPQTRMVEILDTIDGALERGRVVYLHCRGGAGRTGIVVGCWLVRHGVAAPWAAVDAIATLQQAARVPQLPSPQTEEQRRYVACWSEGR